MSTPISSLGNKTPEQLKVAELREELKKRGANVKGLKKELVERLEEVLRTEASGELQKSASNEPTLPISPPGSIQHDVAHVELETLKSAEHFKSAVGSEHELSERSHKGAVLSGDDTCADEDLGPTEVEVDDDLSHRDVKVEKGMLRSDALEENASKGLSVLPTDSVPFVESSLESQLQGGPKVRSSLELNAPAESLEMQSLLPNSELNSAPFVPEVVAPGETEEDVMTEADSTVQVDTEPKNKADAEVLAESTLQNTVSASRNARLDDPSRVVNVVASEEHDFKAIQESPVPTIDPSTDAVLVEPADTEEVSTENVSASVGLGRVADEDMKDVEAAALEQQASSIDEPDDVVEGDRTTTVSETVTVTTTEEITVTVQEISNVDRKMDEELEDGLLVDSSRPDVDYSTNERNKNGDGLAGEEDGKVKDLKPMDIDSDVLTGSKRKDGDEARLQEPAKRQRRWNSSKSMAPEVDAKVSTKVLTSDTLKEIISADSRESGQAAMLRSPPPASSTPKASALGAFEKPAPHRPPLSRTDATVNGESDRKRIVPPPLRSPTNSLKIDRFVRPFTARAVKELLDQTGTVKEMWMDQIKTHCYVTYLSVEEATATRNALYNLQWPVTGGRLLVAEYVEAEEVSVRCGGLIEKPITRPSLPSNTVSVTPPQTQVPAAAPPPTSTLPPPPPLPPPPRDRPVVPLPKKEPELPIPTLDDLFKKTRAKPQIYYLPLTEEQVAAKVIGRNKPPVSKPPVKA